MGFLYPELLIFLAPALFVWWRCPASSKTTQAIRLVALLLVALALAGPYAKTASSGRDLIFVVDRSASMPDNTEQSALEFLQLAKQESGSDDRIGVISFGAHPGIERFPSDAVNLTGFEREVAAHGSDLHAALKYGLELIPEGRSGRLLLISDGESNGPDPIAVGRRAANRGIAIDAQPMLRAPVQDLAVERLDLPERVDENEPFQFSVWIHADQTRTTNFELECDGRLLDSGPRHFQRGMNRLVFRDLRSKAGIAQYTVKVGDKTDRTPENNTGIGVTQVEGNRRVLVVNDDGRPDTLTAALQHSDLAVDVFSPERAPMDPAGLSSYRAVILENVAATRFGRRLQHLKQFVLNRGGGLLVTGGRASYGIGGYYKSPLDPILPVSMEMRQEHRRQAVAVAVAMDRSGSMAQPVTDQLTKMDLANMGTVSALELLSPLDSFAVIAVDQRPDVIQPLSPARELDAIRSRILRIEAGGGGIYTHAALKAAGDLLQNAEQRNRHVILFADAADSEDQKGCPKLLERLQKSNISVSVIALGTDTDTDAEFLKAVARLGRGQVYFTTDPRSLPQLFALDTIKISRSMFVQKPTQVAVQPELFGIGELTEGQFPRLPGYNLTYQKPDALAGALTTDEYRAPVLAHWYQALGRVLCYTGQIGGEYGSSIAHWDGFATLFSTVVRWLSGQEEPAQYFTEISRRGMDAVVALEVDPALAPAKEPGALEARLVAPDGETRILPLTRVGSHRFEARTPLDQEGVFVGVLKTGEREFVTLPAIALPYSPEFERRLDPDYGEKILRSLARASGGMVNPSAGDLFHGAHAGVATRLIGRELALLVLFVMLVEIAGRRLELWSSFGLAAARAQSGMLRMLRKRRTATPAVSAPGELPASRLPRPARSPSGERTDTPAPEAATGTSASALSQAKTSAGKRLRR